MAENTNVPSRIPQKPVFIIEPFDASNVEHMRGNMRVVLNKRFAMDLCSLIRECELSEDEASIFAMQAFIQRWYNQRLDEIHRQKALARERAKTESSSEDEKEVLKT